MNGVVVMGVSFMREIIDMTICFFVNYTFVVVPGSDDGVVKTRKVSCRCKSSLHFCSFAFLAIIIRNSGNSIVPFPSSSNSLMIVCTEIK